MCRGWRCLRSSSSRWPADTGDVQEVLDTRRETQAVGSGEGCGGGAFAVGGYQVGDIALIDRLGGAKQQVSSLCGVRVSGKYLHR